MKTIQVILAETCLLLFNSCISNDKCINLISGNYDGREIIILEISKAFADQDDTNNEYTINAEINFICEQPYISIEGDKLFVTNINEVKNGLSFNIKEQSFMKNMNIQGSAEIEDVDGNQFDGMFDLSNRKVTFSIKGIMSKSYGNKIINTPIHIIFELSKKM